MSESQQLKTKRPVNVVPKRTLSRNSSSAFASEARKKRSLSGSKAEDAASTVSESPPRKRVKSDSCQPVKDEQKIKAEEVETASEDESITTDSSVGPSATEEDNGSVCLEGGLKKTDGGASVDAGKADTLFVVAKSGVKIEIGHRVEALDSFGKWYPAKIIELDQKSKEILIHFERWNSRYDEWVPFSSERLRPIIRPSRHSPKKIKDVNFEVDEIVLARWTDRKMYPAKVIRNDLQGNLTVMFYDGIKKRIKDVYVDKLPPEMETSVAFPPADKQSLNAEKPTHHPNMMLIDDRLKKNRLIVGGKFRAKRKSDEVEKPKLMVKDDGQAEVSASVSKSCALTTGVVKPEIVVGTSVPHITSVVPIPTEFAVQEAKKVARKEFVIEEDHNHFKCPIDKCGKSFRKEKLLQAHLKHYHGETDVIYRPRSIRTTPTARRLSKTSETPSPKIEPRTPTDPPKEVVTPVIEPKNEPLSPKPEVVPPTKKITPVAPAATTAKINRKQNKSDPNVKIKTDVSNVTPEQKKVVPQTQEIVIKPKQEVVVPNLKIPKMEAPKPNIRSPTKVKSAEMDLGKGRTLSESDKSLTPVAPPVRLSKRRRLDTAESVSSTISIDSASVHSEDCSIIDVERPPVIKMEPGVKKSRSRSRKLTQSSASSIVRDEIVNCSCGINEENGFMVQCELCLAWQHGVCAAIAKEDEVPDKYICHSCLNPKLGRESMKYDWDQDWYVKGEMARFNFLPKIGSDQSSAMLSSHNLVASILSIKNVLHSLKYKLKIAENKYHPDLDHFKQPWTKDCKPLQETFNVNDPAMYGTNMEAIASAIGALGIPLPSLNQSFNSGTNDLFDPAFYPKTQDTMPEPYGQSTSNAIVPSTSTDTTVPSQVILTSDNLNKDIKIEQSEDVGVPKPSDPKSEAPIDAVLTESGSNKSILDQYIPDIIPDSAVNPDMLVDNEGHSNADFSAQLPISISESDLVQSIGLSGNFNSGANEDFMAQAAMMDTLTKEEEEEMIKTLSKPMYPMMPPVPKEPDIEQHQKNVVAHVEEMQDELEHRLEILETQVEILEMEFDSETTSKAPAADTDMSKVKRTIKKFLRDMEKLNNMTLA